MRLLRAADHKVMPWKNGAGSTTEIAISPAGAGLGGFDWRVSMAGVAQDGPFSGFPGIERTLAVLEGEGIRLEVEGRTTQDVTLHGAPASFPGDLPTRAALIGGPIVDLNVMTRRGRWAHRLSRRVFDASAEVVPERGILILLALETGLSVGGEELGRLDAVVSGGPLAIEARTAATAWLVELWESPGDLDK